MKFPLARFTQNREHSNIKVLVSLPVLSDRLIATQNGQVSAESFSSLLDLKSGSPQQFTRINPKPHVVSMH